MQLSLSTNTQTQESTQTCLMPLHELLGIKLIRIVIRIGTQEISANPIDLSFIALINELL